MRSQHDPSTAWWTAWQDAIEAQQRHWNEWAEAGQIWLSWVWSTLPPVGWPPAGVVLPPVNDTSRGAAAPQDRPAAAGDKLAALPSPAARKPRAASARHH